MADLNDMGLFSNSVNIVSDSNDQINSDLYVIIDGKKYERRRYTYDELRELFYDKVVILKDASIKDLNLVDGILVDACNPDEEDELAVEYNKDGYKYTFWGFCSFPVNISYKELI